MWEIISSRDFLLNLAAGGVIFVIELSLIVALLPWFLQRRLDRRWIPARAAMAVEFARHINQIAIDLEKYKKTPETALEAIVAYEKIIARAREGIASTLQRTMQQLTLKLSHRS